MKIRGEFGVSWPELELEDPNADFFGGDRDETGDEEPRWEFLVLIPNSSSAGETNGGRGGI